MFTSLIFLSGCTSQGFYNRNDAPTYIKNGGVSPSLLLTQVFGRPFSPLVRNISVPSGKLHHATGLENHLLEILKPLDIILIRSRPALTRLMIPSHFTHGAIWIGEINNSVIDVKGLNSYQIQQKDRFNGKIIFEATGNTAQLSDISHIINVDEIIILRSSTLNEVLIREKISTSLKLLGTPYDYSFNHEDKSKFTCMEIIKELFPEFNLPVRYTAGRYAIIPDDLVRLSQLKYSKVSVIEYIVSDDSNHFKKQNKKTALQVLKSPVLVIQKK